MSFIKRHLARFDVCTSPDDIMIVYDKHVPGRRRKRHNVIVSNDELFTVPYATYRRHF